MCQKVLLGSGWELKQPRGKVLAVVVREKPNALEIVGEQVVKTADRLENRGGRLGCPPGPSEGAGVVLGQLAQLLLLGVALVTGDHQRVGIAHGHLGAEGETEAKPSPADLEPLFVIRGHA